jgi:hypothetical protein
MLHEYLKYGFDKCLCKCHINIWNIAVGYDKCSCERYIIWVFESKTLNVCVNVTWEYLKYNSGIYVNVTIGVFE